MMKKERIKIISVFFVILMVLSNVSAFGIGFAYHKNNPLQMSAGETRNIEMSLQNMAGPDEVNLKCSIIKGDEIIKLIDKSDVYFIPVRGEKMANFQVSIPKNAKNGEVYNIEIEFITVAQDEKGTFNLGSSVGKNFEVYVVQEESSAQNISKNFMWIAIIGIGILVVLAGFILKRKGINSKNRLKFK